MNGRNLTVALMVFAVLLVGCGPADGPALEGTQWTLVALGGEPPLTGTAPSAEFSADQIRGSAGCNTYSGTYAVRGGEISISDVANTEMWCADPEGVMDQEQAFLAALRSAASYRLAGEQLELLDAAGSVTLVLEPGSATP